MSHVAPHSIHESLIEMIQAGFSPAGCHQVQTKLKQVIKNVVDSAVEKYRIPLDGSIAAWLVPGMTSPSQSFRSFFNFAHRSPGPEPLCQRLEAWQSEARRLGLVEGGRDLLQVFAAVKG